MIVFRLVPTEGGYKIKVTLNRTELLSERVYNRRGNARHAAERLVAELHEAAKEHFPFVRLDADA